jgi:SAM-dependent methyltransferase
VDDRTGAESQEERDERLRRGSSFGAAASAYAEHRPGYASAAVAWALEPVNERRPLRVLDLGAGTGKLTETLVGLGADVTAVEPDPSMLAELRRQVGSVRSMPGRAEQIPLPDGAVDAVLAGQAMHWFDLDEALPEIARVLTPGGVLAGLWNADDDRLNWVAELAELSNRQARTTRQRWRDGTFKSREGRLLVEGSAWFGAAEVGEFEHGQVRTADSLLATLATHSHVLVMEPAGRDRLLTGVAEYLRSRPETAAGEFVLPMVTIVLRTRRR